MNITKNLVVIDSKSLELARYNEKELLEELQGNFSLDEDEITEMGTCALILRDKIKEFLHNNPEYGI